MSDPPIDHIEIMKLLIFLILLTGVYVDSKRPKDVLKTIGKRFLERSFGGSMRDRVMGVEEIFWDFLSDDEKREWRFNHTQHIAKLIHSQSSSENPYWQQAQWDFEKLLSSNFEGSACGSQKLNYVQFIDYWKRQREKYFKNDGERTYVFIVDNGELKEGFRMMVTFAQHSKWEYSEKAIYMVDVALKRVQEDTDINIYTIEAVDEVGPCTEHGKVDWRASTLDTKWRLAENDPEEQKKVQRHVEEMFHVDTRENGIPTEWLIRDTSPDGFFKAEVCHDGVLKAYGKKNLKNWWKKFQLMWYTVPGQKNETEVELEGGGRGRYVFRVTMWLQFGWSAKREPQPVRFKLRIEYNVHGDETWYINKFEVTCPMHSEKKLMVRHAEVFKEVIGRRLLRMVLNPEMWYSVTHVFDDLISSGKVEFESCAGLEGQEMEKVEKLGELEQKFWKANKAKNGKMEGYSLGGPEASSEVDEKMWMEISITWTPLKQGWWHQSTWKFHVEWNHELQVYEIVRIRFACPETGLGGRWYKSMFFARIG